MPVADLTSPWDGPGNTRQNRRLETSITLRGGDLSSRDNGTGRTAAAVMYERHSAIATAKTRPWRFSVITCIECERYAPVPPLRKSLTSGSVPLRCVAFPRLAPRSSTLSLRLRRGPPPPGEGRSSPPSPSPGSRSSPPYRAILFRLLIEACRWISDASTVKCSSLARPADCACLTTPPKKRPVLGEPLAVVREHRGDEDLLVGRHVEEPAEEQVRPEAAAQLPLGPDRVERLQQERLQQTQLRGSHRGDRPPSAVGIGDPKVLVHAAERLVDQALDRPERVIRLDQLRKIARSSRTSGRRCCCLAFRTLRAQGGAAGCAACSLLELSQQRSLRFMPGIFPARHTTGGSQAMVPGSACGQMRGNPANLAQGE